jgi:hypothetical protein
MKLKLIVAALFAVFVTAGSADAQNLVPNGDFEIAGGVGWEASVGVGVEFSFPDAGGNGGGYGQIDQTAGGWGGVLVSEVDATTGISLDDLNLTAGMSYTFTIDMIDLTPTPGTNITAGYKVENWAGGVLINDSGDNPMMLTSEWATYTFDFLVDANTTSMKFVPLMVGQGGGSKAGFDNVGVFGNTGAVPEPSSLALISLGVVGLVARRRRK